MSKAKKQYVCNECGANATKWSGKCLDCGAWNTYSEIPIISSTPGSRFSNYAGDGDHNIVNLNTVPLEQQERISSGLSELDRALGQGLVPGAVILIGGDPGIGKSTLILQTLASLSAEYKTLYVTGEESAQQLRLRAKRLGLERCALPVLTETNLELVLANAKQEMPDFMVIDSIQTVWTEAVQSAPGSVSQLRESGANLVKFAKQTNTTILLVGHVTKDGAIAGPRVLEHMVDTVLYFEGDSSNKFRMLRAVKNRFGGVNELGIFSMTDKGLREIANPSAIFLSNSSLESACGSVVMVTWEGTRPILVEIQALVDESPLGNPRRVTVGLEPNRLALILAVLNRHGRIMTYNQDIFVNVVGGVKVSETGIDLAALAAVVSSFKNKPIVKDMVIFGEIGLSGEVRPVQGGQDRLKEAAKLGFKSAIVPYANAPKKNIDNMQVHPVKNLQEALELILT